MSATPGEHKPPSETQAAVAGEKNAPGLRVKQRLTQLGTFSNTAERPKPLPVTFMYNQEAANDEHYDSLKLAGGALLFGAALYAAQEDGPALDEVA